jgi:hypothetical protein
VIICNFQFGCFIAHEFLNNTDGLFVRLGILIFYVVCDAMLTRALPAESSCRFELHRICWDFLSFRLSILRDKFRASLAEVYFLIGPSPLLKYLRTIQGIRVSDGSLTRLWQFSVCRWFMFLTHSHIIWNLSDLCNELFGSFVRIHRLYCVVIVGFFAYLIPLCEIVSLVLCWSFQTPYREN